MHCCWYELLTCDICFQVSTVLPSVLSRVLSRCGGGFLLSGIYMNLCHHYGALTYIRQFLNAAYLVRAQQFLFQVLSEVLLPVAYPAALCCITG